MIFSFPFRFLFSSASSLAISVYAYRRKSLSLSGAIAAVVVGFTLTLASYCFFTCLLAFFVSSSLLTKWKSKRKEKIDEDFKEGGQRNWIQVFCNSALPVVVSTLYLMEVGWRDRPINFGKNFMQSALSMAVLGAIACCNGDTWSSEIGTAVGPKTPRLITNLKKVPIGTNGAVSFVGTIASMIGGLLVGIVYYVTIVLLEATVGIEGSFPPQWPVILLGGFAGLVGSVIDSILGATVQYSGFCDRQKKVVQRPSPSVKHICGRNILDNNLVNLVSSTLTGFLTFYVAYSSWRYVD